MNAPDETVSPAPPATHGGRDDPRYPSPTVLRSFLAFAVDLLLHAGVAVGAFYWFRHLPKLANFPTLPAVGVFVVLSFTHRTLVQWAFRTTLGKALFGLCVIEPEDGGRPGFERLARAWVVGAVLAVVGVIETLGSSGSGFELDENAGHFLPIVRRRDVRRLRSARHGPVPPWSPARP